MDSIDTPVVVIPVSSPPFLRLVTTGEVFVYTDLYAARGDMVADFGAALTEDEDRADLAIKWKAKFGRMPTANTRLDTLREKTATVTPELVAEYLAKQAALTLLGDAAAADAVVADAAAVADEAVAAEIEAASVAAAAEPTL